MRLAMAFGYMELLVRLGDRQKFFEEIARLQSLNNLLNDMGYDETVYEDFVNVTTELLRDLANAADPGSMLLERFNDAETSNAIIVHLRVCLVKSETSASCMLTRVSDDYKRMDAEIRRSLSTLPQ